MKKILTLITLVTVLFASCCNKEQQKRETMSSLKKTDITTAIEAVESENSLENIKQLERGVNCAAKLWTEEDGTPEEFVQFCKDNYQVTEEARHNLFCAVQRNLEAINGRYNQIGVDLKMPIHVTHDNPVTVVDDMFGSIDPFAHFSDDMFDSKIAFVVLLNFPTYTLDEKNELGAKWSRQEWAYARMGDLFGARVPASVNQNYANNLQAAENYISNYNIMMGKLRNDDGEQLFADDMALITHWGLRDELKANYANTDGRGLEKQQMIYQIMNRIVDQTIPQNVISNEKVTWNPYTNEVKDNSGKIVDNTREKDVRYQKLYNIYKASLAMDKYYPTYPTYLNRAFDQQMEVTDEEIEQMFIEFITAPEVKQVAKLVKTRLGRELEPFDIWYDGFKSRGSINEDALTAQTRKLYPDTEAFEKGLPDILRKLGFSEEKVELISSKVKVDPSLGAGHAWGTMAKYDISRLRTRIAKTGMDYKGYNIAVHEFGHNVEQTISVNDIDNYIIYGVPNTAISEALAFVFQKRDLQLLGYEDTDDNAHAMQSLDIFWGCYEIMGVSLVDLYTWRWLYENPGATVEQMKQAIINNATTVWNKYYAPVLGHEGSTILAIYSHSIEIPLYLPNYPYGHIVESQLESYLQGKIVGEEIPRIYKAGRLTPDYWMQNAVGESVSTKPLLNEVSEAVKIIK